MDKRACCSTIEGLIQDAQRNSGGDCERDYNIVLKFMDDAKATLQKIVANPALWISAYDSACFNCSAGIGYGSYDKTESQNAYIAGWNKTIALLSSLKQKIESATDDDIRWSVDPNF